MVFLYIFVVTVLSICALLVWSRVVDEPRAARPWRDPMAAPPEAPPGQSAGVEGVLAAQLTAGDITERQYVEAMERLAARDGGPL
jgi:hypothetical protein